MKTLYITLGAVALSSLQPALAQNNINGSVSQTATNQFATTVSGRVLDQEGGNGLDLVNVVLVSDANQKQYYNYTEEDGTFSIENVPFGSYTLKIYFVGFKGYERKVSINAQSNSLGDIVLVADGTRVTEVIVTDFKKVIEQRPDGINYNVENDKSAQGTSATDVLRKVPMVTVDMEGNVSLRGSSNIKVLIDGKPSELVASSVKDALRQIPAENIKNIEVITSPGAKYDGEGTSGVINIVTKRKMVGGFSGMIFAGPSYNLDQNLLNGHIGTNLNYRRGKLGINTSLGFSRWSMVLDSEGERTDFPGTPNESVLKTKQHMYGYGNFGWGKLGLDYQIDSLQSVQLSANYNPGEWNQEVEIDYASLGFRRNAEQRNPRNTLGFNAAYSRKSAQKPGRTLDLLAAYSMNNVDAGYNVNNINTATDQVNYREINDNDRKNNELTVQADFVEPLKAKGQKLEYGLKGINRSISSDFALRYNNNGNGDFVADPARSGNMSYSQSVGAAYAQITSPLTQKLSMVAGARYEATYINGDQFIGGGGGDFTLPMYHNFLPNLVFMYDLGNFNKLKLSYTKRINRPSIDFVNPYIDYSDPMNLKQGNVNLDPERTHNVELGYNTFFGRTSFNASLFHRYTGNAIEQVTRVDENDNVSRTTFDNIAKVQATGLDLFTSSTLFRKLMLNLNGSIYYKHLTSESLDMSTTGWQYSGNMYANYTLTRKFSINGFAMYNGNQVLLQGTQGGWYYYFLGAQMNILKGKGQIGVAAENFLSPKVHIPTRLTYTNATQNMNSIYSGRGVRVSFNWSFGKMQFAQEKTVKNDDLKKAEGGQIGIGGGQQ
ncbi:MAG TPA: outer membrane beta-barrel family protein [Edaphocola sp.]|nr:outer membrane beta-barrel family protein [Edaphocola sp.]